jgi:hypothetical protein
LPSKRIVASKSIFVFLERHIKIAHGMDTGYK